MTRLMKRGCARAPGRLRDSLEIARLALPAYYQHPSAPTDLPVQQTIEINCLIGCGDAPASPGDVILGDNGGAIVVPAHLTDQIADETL